MREKMENGEDERDFRILDARHADDDEPDDQAAQADEDAEQSSEP
jgi:hypothetical protein